MRQRPVLWLLVVPGMLAVLGVAAVGPAMILWWDLGERTEDLSAMDRAAALTEIRSTVVQGLGAVLLLVGAYVGWRQLRHSIDNAQAQLDLQRRGSITDRYTRVIDQLASPDQAVRVGAVYALGRIAVEAESERAGVMGILAAFVRSRAPAGSGDLPPLDDPGLPLRSRAQDVQAALTVLTAQITPGPAPVEWLTADLGHTDLRNCNFFKATLWHVRFRGANLAGANLAGADLRGADLRGSVLDGADLTDARADGRTWWPDGFDPATHGVVHR